MSGFSGKEVSGTPLETRDLTTSLAGEFQGLLGNPGAGVERIAATFGLDPSTLGLQDFASSIMGGESPGLRGFDNANRMFQNRAINEGERRLLTSFGGAGGRFSRNAMEAAGRQGAEMEAEFDRNRFDFSQQRRGQDIQFLAQFLNTMPGLFNAANSDLRMASQFAAPGAPIWQEGWGAGAIGALGSLGGAALGNPAGLANLWGGMPRTAPDPFRR